MGLNIFANLTSRVRTGLVQDGASEEQIDASMASFYEFMTKVSATDAALQIMDEEILAKAVETVEKEFADQPLVEAALREAIGDTYYSLGLYPKSLPQMKSALAIHRLFQLESTLGEYRHGNGRDHRFARARRKVRGTIQCAGQGPDRRAVSQ